MSVSCAGVEGRELGHRRTQVGLVDDVLELATVADERALEQLQTDLDEVDSFQLRVETRTGLLVRKMIALFKGSPRGGHHWKRGWR